MLNNQLAWSKIILASVLYPLLLGADSIDGSEMLTVEQTVRVASVLPMDARPGEIEELRARANPKALPQIRESARNPRSPDARTASFLVLGYVGDDEDVILLRSWIENLHGELTGNDYTCLQAAMKSICRLRVRGIRRASGAVDQMIQVEYWRSQGFTFADIRPTRQLTVADEMVLLTIRCLGTVGASDARTILYDYLDTISDPARRRIVNSATVGFRFSSPTTVSSGNVDVKGDAQR